MKYDPAIILLAILFSPILIFFVPIFWTHERLVKLLKINNLHWHTFWCLCKQTPDSELWEDETYPDIRTYKCVNCGLSWKRD